MEDGVESIGFIGEGDALRICGAQLIVGLHSIVKELVENSIDANAKAISIQIKNYGLESISVQDDGNGISPEDYELVARQYSTSKISTFEDSQRLKTLGFRGEALNSLCTLSNVNIVTRTARDEMAMRLDFDSRGNLIKKTPSNAGVGTCVTVSDIFKPIPVRRLNLKKNAQREYQRFIQCVESYAIIRFDIAFNILHVEKNRGLKRILFTNGRGDMKQALESVWTRRVCSGLIFFEMEILDFGYVQGYISELDISRMQRGNRHQVIYINQRPVENAKIQRSINDFYRRNISAASNMKLFPVFVLSFTLRFGMVDFNLMPDKRQVVLQEENEIIETILKFLVKLFALDKIDSNTREERELGGSIEGPAVVQSPGSSEGICTAFKSQSSSSPCFSSCEVESSKSNDNRAVSDTSELFETLNFLPPIRKISKPIQNFSNSSGESKRIGPDLESPRKRRVDDEGGMDHLSKSRWKLQVEDDYGAGESRISELDREGAPELVMDNYRIVAASDESLSRSGVISDLFIEFDIHEYTRKFKSLLRAAAGQKKGQLNLKRFKAKLFDNDNGVEVEEELSRLLNKQDFSKMRIVGQFNLGFIITELDRHLFIFDQHASDEKYNYETMYHNAEFAKQRLLVPMDVEVSPAEEEMILGNLEVFRKNGFEFSYDENQPPFKRLKLISHPFYNDEIFETSDILEILDQLRTPSVFMPRPKRLYKILASRACRSSVMVGQALSAKEMERIVANMGTMNNPWNCPHGRPTMRHLMNVSAFTNKKNVKKCSLYHYRRLFELRRFDLRLFVTWVSIRKVVLVLHSLSDVGMEGGDGVRFCSCQ